MLPAATVNGAGMAKATDSPAAGAITGVGAAALLATLLNSQANTGVVLDWREEEEDEADEMAFNSLLKSNMDVREIPKL